MFTFTFSHKIDHRRTLSLGEADFIYFQPIQWVIFSVDRHEAIMLQKLNIMFLSSGPKITYYAYKKMPIIPKIMPLTLANNISL